MYLADVSLLWWHRRLNERSDEPITTWDQFLAKLTQQFYLEHAEDEAQAKLCWLEQKGDIHEYV